jgi:hypothetical protein
MRNPRIRYNTGDSLDGESFDARARKVVSQSLRRRHNGRTIGGKRLRLEGTAYAEITAGPAPGSVVGDALSAELIIAEADKVQSRSVTRGSSTHHIQQLRLRGNVYCIISRPLKFVRESP